MYNEYFGFKKAPFSLAPDPPYLYMSELHREALAHLIYGIKSDGGFVLLTGEVGTGKTTVCRCLLEQVPENTEIAFILNPKLTVEELLAVICDEFGIRYPEGNKSIKVFVDLINAHLLDITVRGKKAVLIIDEAQNLGADVLEQLRLLTNLETNQQKLLQTILLGQPELKDKLSTPELRQLSQRITALYHLGPLSKKEAAAYVTHRLVIAGSQKQLFAPSTISKLYHLSGGVPRLINVLCDRALLGAFVQGQNLVNKPTLMKAADEVFGKEKHVRNTTIWLLIILSTVAIAALAMTYYNNYEFPHIRMKTTKPAAATQKEPSVIPEYNALQWTPGQPITLSKKMAFQSLYKQWGINYQAPKDVSPCEQARIYGLNCLNSQGSLNSLRNLNRPAVLKLFDHEGKEFYAALTALDDKTGTLVVGVETKTVAVKDILSSWLGEYTILWKPPQGYRGDIRQGSRGEDVKWLDERLSIIQGRKSRPTENLVFDEVFVRDVKKFQLARGLVPDGIVGPQTIMHLNTATNGNEPKLIKE